MFTTFVSEPIEEQETTFTQSEQVSTQAQQKDACVVPSSGENMIIAPMCYIKIGPSYADDESERLFLHSGNLLLKLVVIVYMLNRL